MPLTVLDPVLAGGKGRSAWANALVAEVNKLIQYDPPGVIKAFGGTVAPLNHLLCQGQSVLRADYPDLFAAIGTTYGSVDGTHFTIPDGRGRTLIGSGTGDAGDATAHALGQKSGTEGVTLSAAQSGMPTHTPTASGSSNVVDTNHYHLIGGTTGVANQGHRHGTGAAAYYVYADSVPSTTIATDTGNITLYLTYAASTGYDIDAHNHNEAANTNWQSVGAGAGAYQHSHTITVTVNQVTGVAASAAHSSMQPFLAINYIIRY